MSYTFTFGTHQVGKVYSCVEIIYIWCPFPQGGVANLILRNDFEVDVQHVKLMNSITIGNGKILVFEHEHPIIESDTVKTSFE